MLLLAQTCSKPYSLILITTLLYMRKLKHLPSHLVRKWQTQDSNKGSWCSAVDGNFSWVLKLPGSFWKPWCLGLPDAPCQTNYIRNSEMRSRNQYFFKAPQTMPIFNQGWEPLFPIPYHSKQKTKAFTKAYMPCLPRQPIPTPSPFIHSCGHWTHPPDKLPTQGLLTQLPLSLVKSSLRS